MKTFLGSFSRRTSQNRLSNLQPSLLASFSLLGCGQKTQSSDQHNEILKEEQTRSDILIHSLHEFPYIEEISRINGGEQILYLESESRSQPMLAQSLAEPYLSEHKDITHTKTMSDNPKIAALVYGNANIANETDFIWGSLNNRAVISFSFIDSDLNLLDENDYNYDWQDGEKITNYVYNHEIFNFNEAQKFNIRTAFSEFEKVLDLNFVEVIETGNQVGTIRIGVSAGDFGDYAAFAIQPGPYWSSSGDIWFDKYAVMETFDPGSSYYYSAMLHELAHAMGLKHPHEQSHGNLEQLDVELDASNYTQMSYNHPDWGWHTVDGSQQWTVSHGLQVYDIQALQYLYGPNLTFNTTNTIYEFKLGQPFSKTIWDAGGIDLLDFSELLIGCQINLVEGSFSTIPQPNWVPKDNLGIAFNTLIENVIGSKGDDTIIGNAANNRLSGHDGDDVLFGGEGHDILIGQEGVNTLYGGAGDDTYVLDVDDQCRENAGEGFDIIQLIGVHTFTFPENIECVRSGALSTQIFGNSQNNIFISGEGDDIFTGNGGADVFVIGNDMGHDTFTDFNQSEGDRIEYLPDTLLPQYLEFEFGFMLELDQDNTLTVLIA